jgi:hypothetical protein
MGYSMRDDVHPPRSTFFVGVKDGRLTFSGSSTL